MTLCRNINLLNFFLLFINPFGIFTSFIKDVYYTCNSYTVISLILSSQNFIKRAEWSPDQPSIQGCLANFSLVEFSLEKQPIFGLWFILWYLKNRVQTKTPLADGNVSRTTIVASEPWLPIERTGCQKSVKLKMPRVQLYPRTMGHLCHPVSACGLIHSQLVIGRIRYLPHSA